MKKQARNVTVLFFDFDLVELSVLFPRVVIVYVQTLYGSLMKFVMTFQQDFLHSFVLKVLTDVEIFFKVVLKTSKHFVKYGK